jgi:glucan phosphoethanolaminetransferase (alkaline phosphatase superfamily)
MPETVLGLPLHPLVVHAAVVLVPVASVLAIIVAVSQDRRARWGVLTWLLTTAAWGATVVAKLSGEALAEVTYGDVLPIETADHGGYGNTAVWFTLALWLAVSGLLLIDLDRRRRHGFGSPVLVTVVAVATIIAAMAASGQVLLTGWTGAENAWVAPEEVG